MTSCHDHGNCELCDWQEARIARLEEALSLVLPLAKGYAAAHPVGSNATFVATAEAALVGRGEGHPHDADTSERLAWEETAAQYARNVAYWRKRTENAEARDDLEERDE